MPDAVPDGFGGNLSAATTENLIQELFNRHRCAAILLEKEHTGDTVALVRRYKGSLSELIGQACIMKRELEVSYFSSMQPGEPDDI